MQSKFILAVLIAASVVPAHIYSPPSLAHNHINPKAYITLHILLLRCWAHESPLATRTTHAERCVIGSNDVGSLPPILTH